MGGETTEMSETTTRVLVEAAHWDAGLDVPHRPPAQDHLRGRQAQRARRRPDDLRGRGRPGGRAAHDVRRRDASSPASPWSARRPPPATITIPVDLPARITGIAIDDGHRRSRNLEAVGCEVAVDGDRR